MDIRQIVRDIRANAVVAVAVFLLCAVVGWAAAFLPAKHYQATTTILAEPAPNTSNPEGAVAVIQYVLALLPTEATSPATLDKARALVGPQYAGVSVNVTATNPPGTGIVEVAVMAPSAGAAAAYANGVTFALEAEQPANSLYVLTQLSKAIPPAGPDNSRLPVLVGAVGFGVIAMLFAALGAAGVRRRLSRVAEIRDRIGAAVIGEIPGMHEVRPAELFTAGVHTVEVEAFQELRSNLLLTMSSSPVTIAVTSCDPAEGKTTICANLAWTLAFSGTPVVAVDSDLRRPGLHLALNAPFGPGLASGRVADTIKRTWWAPGDGRLGVIPAGVTDRHPADVITAHLPLLLDELKKVARVVVIDCPPTIGIAETPLIASIVDMVVVVVDARRFRPERLQQSLARLEAAGATIGGVVLNRVRFGRKRRIYSAAYRYARTDSTTSPANRDTVPRLTKARGRHGRGAGVQTIETRSIAEVTEPVEVAETTPLVPAENGSSAEGAEVTTTTKRVYPGNGTEGGGSYWQKSASR